MFRKKKYLQRTHPAILYILAFLRVFIRSSSLKKHNISNFMTSAYLRDLAGRNGRLPLNGDVRRIPLNRISSATTTRALLFDILHLVRARTSSLNTTLLLRKTPIPLPSAPCLPLSRRNRRRYPRRLFLGDDFRVHRLQKQIRGRGQCRNRRDRQGRGVWGARGRRGGKGVPPWRKQRLGD